MAVAKFSSCLREVGAELDALYETLASRKITESLALRCQHILENVVFVNAIVEVKNTLKLHYADSLDKNTVKIQVRCQQYACENQGALGQNQGALGQNQGALGQNQGALGQLETKMLCTSSCSQDDKMPKSTGIPDRSSDQTNLIIESDYVQSSLLKHGEKNQKKKESSEMFSNEQNLKVHIKAHTAEKRYECKQCEKRFHNLRLLHQHEKRHDVPFLCTTCGKRFANKNDLQTHGYSHTGERPFGCDQCEKSFRSRQCLGMHIRGVHVEGKRWKCEHCEFQTKFQSHFKLHMKRNHHNGPIACDKCGQQFTSYNKLTLHKFEHRNDGNPYTCKLCSKAFVNKKLLTAHTRTHTDERPFPCSFCSKGFKTANARSNHELIHKGLKPHSCEICQRSFTQRSTMKTHINNVHKKQLNSPQRKIQPPSSESCQTVSISSSHKVASQDPLQLLDHTRQHTNSTNGTQDFSIVEEPQLNYSVGLPNTLDIRDLSMQSLDDPLLDYEFQKHHSVVLNKTTPSESGITSTNSFNTNSRHSLQTESDSILNSGDITLRQLMQ